MKTLRKYHKWPSLFIGLFLLLTAISGIIMNHRDWFSNVNFPRQLLPPGYQYKNWNLAALKGNIALNDSSYLVYGNIGIYCTDKRFNTFTDFNQGLGKGIDKRKIFTMLRTENGNLYAGTLFGLYRLNTNSNTWEYFRLPEQSPRVVRLEQQGSQIHVLTRSHLYTLTDAADVNQGISEILIPRAENEDGKVSLFRTLWIIHSGELMGLPGKILVDMVGLGLIFIVLSGFYYTFLPTMARKSGEKLKKRLKRINRFSINWHNNLGVYGILFLLLTTVTGMFLRPPLLIPIAYSRVKPIPGSILEHVNPWHDKLRDMIFDPASNSFIVSTSEGFYKFKPGDSISRTFPVQPEVSVMGITAFEHLPEGGLLVASFSGIYQWYPENNTINDYVTKLPSKGSRRGNPFGTLALSGIIRENGKPLAMIDYQAGWVPLNKSKIKPSMPEQIRKLPFSLWNYSLEVHTGRIFSVILSDFYVLYVPLLGLTTLLILITGLWLWLRLLKNKNKNKYLP
ncbi:MAG: PepSY domain-containing protein [Lentimicrobium sp.]|nr:PepSY domain-containing protein [Lentimicrobium sp.]